MPLSRRRFLNYSAGVAGSISLSTALSGCTLADRRAELSDAAFSHGVASGDPATDGMVLWTRAVPPGDSHSVVDATDTRTLSIGWELAADAAFRNVVRSGVAQSRADRDFTVKIDVRDLSPGQQYYYRFQSKDDTSAVGRTRTLPVGSVESLRFVVFSCSNYPAGYFHAYADASQLPDVDAFLHLGDYFYEYGEGGYATERAAELGREFAEDNRGELYNLIDYRRRYALYRGDTDLQAMHAAAPMIAVWDDHEIANDTWREGAQNHSPDEGDFGVRRAAAVQAYFEWLPLRPLVPDAQGRIYRSFDFGDLASLHMLDTRLIGRDQQLEYASYSDAETGEFASEAFIRDLTAKERSLLGDEQRDWLYGALRTSQARWQVLGQQILIARMQMPAQILGTLFRERDVSDSVALIAELAEDKAKLLAGEDLGPERMARLRSVLPYNLDAWDGYPVEREKLYAAARALNKSLVVLSGDTHNAWSSRLRDGSGNVLGVELATPGVSSPGMESYLGLDQDAARRLASGLQVLIDELEYCELQNRGYLEVRLTPEKVEAEWRFVDDITRRDYAMSSHKAQFTVDELRPSMG